MLMKRIRSPYSVPTRSSNEAIFWQAGIFADPKKMIDGLPATGAGAAGGAATAGKATGGKTAGGAFAGDASIGSGTGLDLTGFAGAAGIDLTGAAGFDLEGILPVVMSVRGVDATGAAGVAQVHSEVSVGPGGDANWELVIS